MPLFADCAGNDPQSVSHRSHCLANKSRRLQGLLSIECGTTAVVGAPTQVTPLFVGTVGIEPTWDLLTFQPRIRRRVYVPCYYKINRNVFLYDNLNKLKYIYLTLF